MKSLVRSFAFLLLLSTHSLSGIAQTTISTQPLAQTSVCPGTLLNVSFAITGTFNPGNTFAVQLTRNS